RTAGVRRFRSNFVVTKHSHEHLFVYGSPRVVKHGRVAGAIAEFRALLGSDDQSFRCFLIAQNGHAERLASGDGRQLPVFFRLLLWLFSLFHCLVIPCLLLFCLLFLCLFSLWLRLFGLSLCWCRVWLRCLLRKYSRGHQGKDPRQSPVYVSHTHRASCFLARLVGSAV